MEHLRSANSRQRKHAQQTWSRDASREQHDKHHFCCQFWASCLMSDPCVECSPVRVRADLYHGGFGAVQNLGMIGQIKEIKLHVNRRRRVLPHWERFSSVYQNDLLQEKVKRLSYFHSDDLWCLKFSQNRHVNYRHDLPMINSLYQHFIWCCHIKHLFVKCFNWTPFLYCLSFNYMWNIHWYFLLTTRHLVWLRDIQLMTSIHSSSCRVKPYMFLSPAEHNRRYFEESCWSNNTELRWLPLYDHKTTETFL